MATPDGANMGDPFDGATGPSESGDGDDDDDDDDDDDEEDVEEGADISYLATNMNATTSTSTSTSSSSDMASEDTPAASASAASSADCASIVDTVCAMEGVTVFCDVLTEKMLIPGSSPSEDDHNNNKSSSSSSSSADSYTASKGYGSGYGRYHRLSEDVVDDALGLNEVSQEFTLFVPTDAAFAKTTTAFAALTEEEAGRVIMFHFYEGMLLTADKLVCGEKIISMNEKGDASRTKCD